MSPLNYHRVEYSYPPGFVKEVHSLRPRLTYQALSLSWLIIIGTVILSRWYLIHLPQFWAIYPVLAIILASRQGALLNIVHEGSHTLITRHQKLNDIVAGVCALFLGIDFEGFRYSHKLHHTHTGTPQDPPSDTEKYHHTDLRSLKMVLLFLKDLFGITAVQIFIAYKTKQFDAATLQQGKLKFIYKLMALLAIQLALFAALFDFNSYHYILFWVFPAMTVHMVLMRIRGIAEHGLPRQLRASVENGREGSRLTRTFLSSTRSYRFPLLKILEKFLIGSININYHHEHHALPKVPFYNLPNVHTVVSTQLKNSNPALYDAVYERGYFTAFLAGYRKYAAFCLEGRAMIAAAS